MRIDHVLLAAGDLETSADRLLETYGLASVPGGRHDQWGTGNRIVPLGGQYLEIIGITDPVVAAANPLGRWVRARSAEADTLAGLMVEPDDFDGVCERLSLTPLPGGRRRPDGTSVSWRLAGLDDVLARTLPGFISWNRRDDTFTRRLGGTAIVDVELGGNADQLGAWLGAAVDGLRLVGGAPGIRRMTIAAADGNVVLPEHP